MKRLYLQSETYKLTIKYQPGRDNPSDYISRHPIVMCSKERSHKEKVAEQYVNFIANQAFPKAMTLSEIKCASMTDRTLQKVIDFTRNGKLYEVKKMRAIKD